MEVYIDDVIVKLADFRTHLGDLENAFARMKRYNLKTNSSKCASGVSTGNLLGFLVHEKEIEVDANKAKAVRAVRLPRTIKEVQSFLGKVNYLRRFISNATGKLRPITKLLKNKAANLVWGFEQHEAFEAIKQAIAEPPVSVPPKVFTCTRLEHYILPRETEVVSKMDLKPLKVMKGQVVTDILTEFTITESEDNELVLYIGTSPWRMFFDGSRANGRSGARVILKGPGTQEIMLQLRMEEVTHNSAEYEALILGLEMLVAKNVQPVVIYGDSQLIINQVLGWYICNYPHLRQYRDVVHQLLSRIAEVTVEHIPRAENQQADGLAQGACRQINVGNINMSAD
ncbi:uncharacterized protein LOC127241625 [Andrographis paniculata]|uniref:uncharacterized protein LOC127241625 n=1 Tax=Andrographis paniculata TaxID=175694 RepID=UPI0021E91E45|nr:uncharacterized protein LOC127241625 [Andrographis paniculata]